MSFVPQVSCTWSQWLRWWWWLWWLRWRRWRWWRWWWRWRWWRWWWWWSWIVCCEIENAAPIWWRAPVLSLWWTAEVYWNIPAPFVAMTSMPSCWHLVRCLGLFLWTCRPAEQTRSIPSATSWMEMNGALESFKEEDSENVPANCDYALDARQGNLRNS